MSFSMLRRPLRNLGWLLGSRGINAVLSLVYLALATRLLGLEGFGQFAMIVVMAQAVAGVASFSAWQAVVHLGASGEEVRRTVGFAIALDLVSVAAGSVLAAAVVFTAPLWLPLDPDLRAAALAMCLAALVAIRSTPTGVLRLRDRYDLATVAEAALPMVRALGAIIAAVVQPSIAGFIAAWCVAELACAALYWHFAMRLQPVGFRDISLRRQPRNTPGIWRFVWATSLSRSLAVMSRQVLLLVVGALGGAAMAGGFRVASQLGQALAQLGEAVIRALYPDLVRRPDLATRMASGMALLSLGAGLVAVAVAVGAGEWIIGAVAGPQFVFAYPAMVLMATAGCLELLASSAEAYMVARDRPVRAFAIRAVPLLIAFGIMPLAIREFALPGAATCVLAASLLSTLGLGYSAWFRLARR
jgi:O-antigen/teichoic acid export membrane protein